MGEENASCRTGAREIGFDRHQGHLPVVDAIPREIEVEFPAEDIFALGPLQRFGMSRTFACGPYS